MPLLRLSIAIFLCKYWREHRGGEIDTIRESSVQTLMNGAVGAGVTWNIDRRILKRVNVELDAAGYYQQKGELWPYRKGIGVYSSAFVDLGNFRVKMGHWICNDFITMLEFPISEQYLPRKRV